MAESPTPEDFAALVQDVRLGYFDKLYEVRHVCRMRRYGNCAYMRHTATHAVLFV